MAFSGFGQPSSFGGGGNFGSPAQPATTGFSFGAQPQQQQQSTSQFGTGTQFGTTSATPAFGNTFGTNPATSSTLSGFGQQPQQQQQQQSNFSFGSNQPATQTFGQPATQTFGQPASQPFGQPATQTFGQPATQTFGQPATQTFGQPATQTFGQPATTTTTSTGFGFGGFGTTQQQTAPQQQNTSLFGTTSGGAFGTPQTGSLFGGTQSAQPFGSTLNTGFGAPQQSGGIGGSMFGAKTANSFAFPQPSFSLGAQQQPIQQQQQLPQIDEVQAFQQSIFQCHKFGDERDSTLASLNYLQACLGAGKGYYSQTFPPVNYTPQNPFYRFKAVGYAFMYTDSNEDGQVVVNFKKPQDKLQTEETNIITCLQTILARSNIIIRFTGTKAISENSTMAIVYAEDRNTLRRVPATDMAAALCQPHLKPQLESLGVTAVNAKVKPSPEQLKRYLENPPDGIDPRVWQQAQEDNPDVNSMIPTSLVGIEALKSRLEWQEKETQQHHVRLKLIGDEVGGLLNRHANMSAELQQMRRKQVVLAHRLISIICRQEMMRKQGSTLDPDEEALRKKMEELATDLNSPTQYKGRLNELLSQIRLHKSSSDNRAVAKYNVDPTTLAPIKDFLSIQQESVKHLVSTTKSDLDTLKEMMDGLNKITTKVLN